MNPKPHAEQQPVPRRPWQRALAWLPDVTALGAALACAVLAAVLVGSIGGCGGGVGTEGTGTFASVGSGPITGFGSIVVSGVRYDDSSAAVTDEDGNSTDRSVLALGMVVQVQGGAVVTAADGITLSATATSVRTQRALVGPAAAVDAVAGSLTVLGQLVLVTGDTTFGDGMVGGTRSGLMAVATGQVLEVYGLYDASRTAWVATRIAAAPANSDYRVNGPVQSVDGAGTFTLGRQVFSGSTAGMTAGSLVQLQLQPAPDDSGRWVVRTQRADDKLPDDQDDAGVEGVVATVQSATRFTVDGVPVDSSAAQVDGTVAAGVRVAVRGSLRAGVLVASRVQAAAPEVVRGYELKGTPAQLNTATHRFVLRGVTVAYAGAAFQGGNAAGLVGYTGVVEVKGQLSADRQVLEASEVKFED